LEGLKKAEELGAKEGTPRSFFITDAQTIRKNNSKILPFYAENEFWAITKKLKRNSSRTWPFYSFCKKGTGWFFEIRAGEK